MALMACAVLLGCQNSGERVDAYAALQGMERRVVSSERFVHVQYWQGAVRSAQQLHVYIEGDGQPWLGGGYWPARDPTPARPLALELMALDGTPAIYLGRPCYFVSGGNCEPRLWTSARYSDEVVAALALALQRSVDGLPAQRLVLIGYSGGGALAVLLASRVARVEAVFTVAANLDTARWADERGFLPLAESLNPLFDAQLAGIAHYHVVGAMDKVVNPVHVRRFSERHGGQYRVLENFDHSCCWRPHWPALLMQFNRWRQAGQNDSQGD
ncbi:hypothetical protein [Spongiibacter sp.]|uniref:hypothetical protein n=1 Tax=Spongiibacter sp. TaxID=2024860 RepID=UPI003564A341